METDTSSKQKAPSLKRRQSIKWNQLKLQAVIQVAIYLTMMLLKTLVVFYITRLYINTVISSEIRGKFYHRPDSVPSGTCLQVSPLTNITVTRHIQCGLHCMNIVECKSVNIIELTGGTGYLCQILDRNSTGSSELLQPMVNCQYFEPTEDQVCYSLYKFYLY